MESGGLANDTNKEIETHDANDSADDEATAVHIERIKAGGRVHSTNKSSAQVNDSDSSLVEKFNQMVAKIREYEQRRLTALQEEHDDDDQGENEKDEQEDPVNKNEGGPRDGEDDDDDDIIDEEIVKYVDDP
jgi:hypothetical protein